jgi:hypothetical protein
MTIEYLIESSLYSLSMIRINYMRVLKTMRRIVATGTI